MSIPMDGIDAEQYILLNEDRVVVGSLEDDNWFADRGYNEPASRANGWDGSLIVNHRGEIVFDATELANNFTCGPAYVNLLNSGNFGGLEKIPNAIVASIYCEDVGSTESLVIGYTGELVSDIVFQGVSATASGWYGVDYDSSSLIHHFNENSVYIRTTDLNDSLDPEIGSLRQDFRRLERAHPTFVVYRIDNNGRDSGERIIVNPFSGSLIADYNLFSESLLVDRNGRLFLRSYNDSHVDNPMRIGGGTMFNWFVESNSALRFRSDYEDQYGIVDEESGIRPYPLEIIDDVAGTAISVDHNVLQATPFLDGISAVRTTEGSGFIDDRGAYLFEHSFDEVGPMLQRVAPARDGNRWGYINSDGNWIIEPRFVYALPFQGSYAPVWNGHRWGYVNRLGDLVVDFQFAFATPMKDGYAIVADGYVGSDSMINYPESLTFHTTYVNGPFRVFAVDKIVVPPIRGDAIWRLYGSEFLVQSMDSYWIYDLSRGVREQVSEVHALLQIHYPIDHSALE